MFSSKINKLLKSADLHGAPIQFTYNGHTSHQSALGGVLTILSRIGILAYFFVLVSNIANRDKTIQTSYIAKSPTSDFQNYSIDLSHFDLAFTLNFFDNQPHTEERLNYQKYFNIILYYEETIYINNSDGTLTRQVKPSPYLQFGNCSLDRFANLGNEMKIRGLDQAGWFCPQSIKLDLKGQATSQYQNRIKFQVLQCTNSTANNNSCATSDQINAITKQLFIQVASLNTFFDENKFESEPIKRSVNVEVYPLAYGFNQQYVRTLKKSVINTKDSWLSPQFSNEQYTYYQESYLFNKLGFHNVQLLTIGWTCDGQEQFISRKVLSLSDAAATAGGFAGIILLIAKLFARLYSNQLFYSSIFSEIYKVQIPNNEKLSKLQKFKKCNEEGKVDLLQQVTRLRTNLKINTIKQQLMHYFCYFKLKNNQTYKQYENAKKRLLSQLDIVHILESMNHLNIMEKIILKDYQRKALKYSGEHELRVDQPYLSKVTIHHHPIEQQEVFSKIIQHDQKSVNRKLIKEILGVDKMHSSVLKKSKDTGNEIHHNDKAHDNLNHFEYSQQLDGNQNEENNTVRVFMNDSSIMKSKRIQMSSTKDEDIIKSIKSQKKRRSGSRNDE